MQRDEKRGGKVGGLGSLGGLGHENGLTTKFHEGTRIQARV